MGTIVHFKSKKEKIKDWIKEILSANISKTKSAMVLINTGNEVITGYFNADLIEKMNLKQHLELDILDCFMSQNINRYIKYVE